MLQTYRKTVTVQAEQFDGSEKMIKKYDIEKHEMDGDTWFDLNTVEGAMEIVKGDWIVSCESGTWFIPDKIFRRDNVQSFSFEITDKKTAANIELANKLSKENAEVAGRMNRLDEFMHTDEYNRLSSKEQRLMIIQYNAMQVYADVLLQRIDEIKERL